MEKEYKWMVRVDCMTYNHASYIEDALNGFCMQETDFPFVCTIIDDASTDGELNVIKKYLEEHFDLKDRTIVRNEETEDYTSIFARHKTNTNCYFAVLFLKYNHYSIKKDKMPYIAEWQENCKYIALCEGDDYWIDGKKLQKQVDFLENHENVTLVCCRTKQYSVKRQKFMKECYCYNKDRCVKVKDVICRGGLFIATCSIMYKYDMIKNNYPDYCKKCHVGDYPLQIYAAMKGTVFYFNDTMSVYRMENVNSWVGRQKKNFLSEQRLEGILSEVKMLQGFAKDYPSYKSMFNYRILFFIIINFPNKKVDKQGYDIYKKNFYTELQSLNLKDRIRIYFQYYNLPNRFL